MNDLVRAIALAGSLLSATPLTAAELVELSDYFAVKQASRLVDSDYQEIFARGSKRDRFKLIGTTMPTNWDKPFSGPELEALQASLMAISSDGKTLLYWHQKKRRLFGPKKAEGIYRYRAGEGEMLLYPASNLNLFWHRYDKPLPRHIMAISGSACTMETICALNADDSSLTPLAMYGSSPLQLAAYANNVDGARNAIEQGGGVDDENYWGFTALEIAVRKGHDEIALLLLSQGADYRHKRSRSPSVIQLAVHLHRWPVLEALRHELDDPSLLYFAFGGNFDDFMGDDTRNVRQEDLPRLVQMMLNAGLDPASAREPLVFWLLSRETLRGRKAQLDALKLLLARGVRVDQPEPDSLDTPLHLVASTEWRLADGAGDVMNLLIPRMASLDARNRQGLTALQVAMLLPERGDGFAKALRLIESGADDSVEYLCGVMQSPSGMSIRRRISEWHGALPGSYDCGAYR